MSSPSSDSASDSAATSAAVPAGDDPADVGLLSPVTAGTVAETASGDAAVLAAMVRAEAALLRALVRCGIAPPEAETTAAHVAAARVDMRSLALEATAGGNPVIPLVRALRDAVGGEHAGWIHYGATSQDIVDTALALVSRDVTTRINTDLRALTVRLAELAEHHRHTPTVARTLTQQALPTTVGMRAAGWLAGVHDAIRAIERDGLLPVSLGGPVGTADSYGTVGPAALDAFAAELGLSAPVISWHTRRGPVNGLGAALLATGEACGKIAADVLVLSQTEIGEAREGAAGGSSSMPHKANPVRSVLINSAARQLPGLGAILGGSATPEQERPAGAWHAEWQPLRRMLRLAAAIAERTRTVADGLVLDDAAIERNVELLLTNLGRDRDWLTATITPASGWIDRVLRQHREQGQQREEGQHHEEGHG